MREILFRGKRTDNKQWVEGFYALVGEKNPNAYIITNNGRKIRVAHRSVSQYTGLTDKNGKKIFEKDVVKAESEVLGSPFSCAKVGKVVYAECSFFIEPQNTMESEYLFADECADLEILGNIHDNPELLKE